MKCKYCGVETLNTIRSPDEHEIMTKVCVLYWLECSTRIPVCIDCENNLKKL